MYKEQATVSYLLERIEGLERTTKYQYWFVVVAFILGEWIRLIVMRLIG